MAKNITEIPFTEIVERVQELARERPNNQSKIRGIVNDVYTREIPRKEDWAFFLVSSVITLVEQYATGTVSANTGDTVVTFSSDVTISSSMVGRMLKITGNDYLYRVQAMSGTTGATITPPISGNQNVTAASYTIAQHCYSLAADFDRFPKNGGLINYLGGTEKVIPEKPYQEWADEANFTPANDPRFCRLKGTDTAGNTILETNPPSKIAKSVRYDYFIRPKPMRETSAGLIGSVSASGTSVTGDTNTRFTEATTGDYFRINNFGTGSDSEWYRIIAISGNSGLTLQTAFGLSGATSAGYIICSTPQMPSKMHPGILYGSLLQLAADQDDPMVTSYNLKYAEVLSDGKRTYKTRNYQQDIHSIGEDYFYRR
jgi:hypothetical protein